MIDKKRLKKSLIILSLIIIIIIAVIQIGKTLARYESVGTTTRDVDVAFWVVDNDFESKRLFIKDIYPTDIPFEYTFTVSNFNSDGKSAETDMEYEISLTATTNLPLSYVITKNGDTCTVDEQLEADEDGTYYRTIKIGTPDNDLELQHLLEHDTDITDTYCIQITFPKQSNVNGEIVNNRAVYDYADLMEYINLDLSAKQVIGE